MERIRLNPLGGMGGKTGGPTLGAQPKMPAIDPVNVSDRVGTGGLHSYLGHFSNPSFLRAGHNTSGHLNTGPIRKTGKFHGKSNALGHGGRAAQLKARGVPGGVIGELARKAHAAPGQKNYHGKK